METNPPARPARSLVRRLLWPVGMATVVIGASVGAAYWCTNGTAEAETAANPLRPHSAKDELKNLFADDDKPSPLAPEAEQLFGESEQETTAETEAPQPAPVQQAVYGDRYGSYSPQTPLPPLVEEITEESKEVVTRGQGPDVNPLRSVEQQAKPLRSVGLQNSEDNIQPLRKTDSQVRQATAEEETSTDEFDSRQSFPAPPAPQGNAPVTTADPISQDANDPMTAALESAQPLTQAEAPPVSDAPPVSAMASAPNPFASVPNNRYSAPIETQATPQVQTPVSAQSPSLPPAIDMGSTGGSFVSQQPTPAFPIEESPIPTPAEPQLASVEPLNRGITPTPGLASQPGSGRPGERLLEGAQSPSLTILKLAPQEIQVGKRCTFGIRVQNSGQRTAQNVQIHDEIPLGTELVGTAPRASVSGGKVVWDLGTLSVGEERTVEMELIPTEEGELGSVATVMMAAQASAKSRCTKPELAMRLSSQPQVHAGQQQLVQVEITNPGSGQATGVMLLETVPGGVSHEAGPALEFEIGTLAAGETRRLELVLTAEQAGRVKNTMTAKADAGLIVEASCEFEVIAPDLKLTVEGPDRRFLERPATYQVSVDNPGSAAAKEVQLVTQLPKGLQFVSANNMGEYDAAAHSVYWSLAELPANERGTVELVALPVEAGQHTLQVSTKAKDGLTDQANKDVVVEGIAALNFEVVDMDDPIEVGGETTYEIRVVNQGSKAAGNVQVIAIMPDGLRALSGHGDTRHVIQGERVVFAPIPQLGPKAESTFRIQAQGERAGDQRIRVQITTDEIREPITKEESTRVYSDR